MLSSKEFWDILWLYLLIGGVLALGVEIGAWRVTRHWLPPSLALGLVLLWPWALWRGLRAAIGPRR